MSINVSSQHYAKTKTAQKQLEMAERARLIRQAINQGAKSVPEIARITGLGKCNIYHSGRRDNIKLPMSDNGKKKRRNPKLEAVLLSETPIAQIARDFNVSITYVNNFMNENNLRVARKETISRLRQERAELAFARQTLAEVVASYTLTQARQESQGTYVATLAYLRSRHRPQHEFQTLAGIANRYIDTGGNVGLTALAREFPEIKYPATASKLLERLGLRKPGKHNKRTPKKIFKAIENAFNSSPQEASMRDLAHFAKVAYCVVQNKCQKLGGRGNPKHIGVRMYLASEFYEATETLGFQTNEAQEILGLSDHQVSLLQTHKDFYSELIIATIRSLFPSRKVTKPYRTW